MFKKYFLFLSIIYISLNFLSAQTLHVDIDTVLSDFEVNEDGGSICNQSEPSIDIAGDGSYVITWFDERNGNQDVYAQRYDSLGYAIGTNFKINDDEGTQDQYEPDIDVNTEGNFIITWVDERNSYNGDIYCQRYDSLGYTIGTNFKVNDDEGSTCQSEPCIDVNTEGNFIITWVDERNSYNGDIYCQRYDALGNAKSANFLVNNDAGESCQYEPHIAVDSDGNFVITWVDERNSYRGDIYYQQYNALGDTIGVNFKVNDNEESSYKYNPCIIVDASGNFIIVWDDSRNDRRDIYCQRYSSSGNAQGDNFKVNDDENNKYQFEPNIAIDTSGNFIIVWDDSRNGNRDIYCQRYDALGYTVGTNFIVNDNEGTRGQFKPDIAVDTEGNFVITWVDERNDYRGDIYCQQYDILGNAVGLNFMINDDERSTCQSEASIAVDSDGNFVITWVDERNDYRGDIYCQQYDILGNVVGLNFMINDDERSTCQSKPSIAVDTEGDFVIVWEDERNGNSDIYCQRYDKLGNTKGANFKVNDYGGIRDQYEPDIAIYADGNFVIVWRDERNGNRDIFCQLYDSSGNIVGANFMVNDYASGTSQYEPCIAIDANGSFVIAWQDSRNNFYGDIYCQRYDDLGNAVGANFIVNDDEGTRSQCEPDIAVDIEGDFVIVWEDYRSGNSNIYCQRYDALGNAVGFNFMVNDYVSSSHKTESSIAIDANGNFVIIWNNDNNGIKDTYGKLFYSNGEAFDSTFCINNSPDFKTECFNPCVAIKESRIYTVWHENRTPGNGYDILCNILEFSETNIVSPERITHTLLDTNCPNPFNPTTAISYQLSDNSDVELSIFDMNGRKVATLVNGSQHGGYYSVSWDASQVASGIYFYRLQAGNFVDTKKMVFMK